MGLPGWPGGDPGAIRAAARSWEELHDALAGAVEDSDPAMTKLFSTWKGAAAHSFESAWRDFVSTHRKGAAGAAAVKNALEEVADKLDEAHKRYEHMVEAMAATAVVGLGLAIFTGGLSAAAGAAAEVAVASEVTTLLLSLGVEMEAVVTAATAAAEAAGVATEAAVGFAVDFSIGFGMSAGDQALDSALNGESVHVTWDQAALAGLTSAVLGPLMGGKGLPTRIAIGAGGTAASGALSQLDNLLLHGGLKDGKGFNVQTLLVDLALGGLGGAAAKGPQAKELEDLDALLDGLSKNPAVVDLIMKDPAWLDVYAADADIMTAVVATSAHGAIVVTPSGVATMTSAVREAVVSIKAPEALATYTAQALLPQLTARGIEVTKETIKQAIEVEVESVGGLGAVDQMTRAQLKALADRIAAAVPQPVAAH